MPATSFQPTLKAESPSIFDDRPLEENLSFEISRAFFPRPPKAKGRQRPLPVSHCRPSTDAHACRGACEGSRPFLKQLTVSEARAVLRGVDEGLDHLCAYEVAAVVVELPEPEVVARKVRVGAAVRVASEVSEVLHQDEGSILLLTDERRVFRD